MSEIRSAFNDYLRSLSDEQWSTLVAEVRPPAGGAPSLAKVTPDSAPPSPSAASGGLQGGAELYKRLGGSDTEYEDSTTAQAPAIKGMAQGAELYSRMNSKATD